MIGAEPPDKQKSKEPRAAMFKGAQKKENKGPSAFEA